MKTSKTDNIPNPKGYKVKQVHITDGEIVVEYEPKDEKIVNYYNYFEIFKHFTKQHPELRTEWDIFLNSVNPNIADQIKAYFKLAWLANYVNPFNWIPTDDNKGYTLIYNNSKNTIEIVSPASLTNYSNGDIIFANIEEAEKVIVANSELLRSALRIFNTPIK